MDLHADPSLPVSASRRISGLARRHQLAGLLLAVGSLLLTTGWFFHTSPRPEVLGKYSRAWAAFLAVVVAAEALFLFAFYAYRHRLQVLLRRLTFATVTVVIVMIVVAQPTYIIMHHRYLAENVFRPTWTREHPFLQWDEHLHGSVSLAKPPDLLRVVCMGGSTTQGYRVEPHESYPALLEDLLRERYPDRDIEVINAGSCWHTTQHTLIKYLSNVYDYDPDLIVLMHAWNDIYQCGEEVLARGPFRRDYGHFLGALTNRLRPRDRFAERVWRNLFFDNLYSDFRHLPVREPRETPVDPLTPLPSFRRNLRHMADICAADGVQLVLADQPFLYKAEMSEAELAAMTYDDLYMSDECPGVEAMRQAMIAFNQTAREVAREKGIPFVHLEPCVPKDLDHFIDDVHWTPKGYEIVARAISERVDWPAAVSHSDAVR